MRSGQTLVQKFVEQEARDFPGLSYRTIDVVGLILASATLYVVGWVELISDYVGFRFTQPNLHFVSSIVQCETQQWPILEPSPTW
jgi:hypothetical protein